MGNEAKAKQARALIESQFKKSGVDTDFALDRQVWIATQTEDPDVIMVETGLIFEDMPVTVKYFEYDDVNDGQAILDVTLLCAGYTDVLSNSIYVNLKDGNVTFEGELLKFDQLIFEDIQEVADIDIIDASQLSNSSVENFTSNHIHVNEINLNEGSVETEELKINGFDEIIQIED